MSDQRIILEQIQEKIDEIKRKSGDGDYLFRGEPECHEEEPYLGRISSNLWRQYPFTIDEFNIEFIQSEMLLDARRHIASLSGAEKLSDFEILTDTQHYGGRTNLIDFSKNYRVALFFACSGSYKQEGRLILIKRDSIKEMIEIPKNPPHRVEAQESVFVRPPKGYIEKTEAVIIDIPSELKKPMLAYLEYKNISTETIYNDLHGFIRFQNTHGHAYTNFYRGRVNEIGKNFDKAIECYKKAIGFYPRFAEAYNSLGNVYYELYCANGTEESLGESIKNYSVSLEFSNEVDHIANTYCNVSRAYCIKKQYHKAISCCNEALSLNPNLAQAYLFRGFFYFFIDRRDRFVENVNMAIGIDPEIAQIKVGQDEEGKYFGYVLGFPRSLRLPIDELAIQIGDSLMDAKRPDIAINYYSDAIKFNPRNAEAYKKRGVLHGMMAHGITNIYDRAITERYDTASFAKEVYDAAIEDFKNAIKLNPDDAEPHDYWGVVYAKRGKLDQAIEKFSKAIDLDPCYADAYKNRGLAYCDKRKYDLVIKDCKKAVKCNPDDDATHNLLGAAYFYTNEIGLAIDQFNNAIKHNSNNEDAYRNRSMAYACIGKYEKARQDREKAKELERASRGKS